MFTEVEGARRFVLTVTEQAGAGTLIQAHQTQVLHNPHGRATGGSLDGLGNLTLNLQANLDNLEGICEDLIRGEIRTVFQCGESSTALTTWQPPAVPPARIS